MDQGGIEVLLRQWRQTRNPEALGELLKTQRDRAYAIALRVTSSAADAEDVVQDACIKLMSRTHGFDNVEDFELTVYRAVMQCSLNRLRTRRRQKTHEDEARIQKQGEVQVQDVEQHATGAAERETCELLRRAVAELPNEERAPVVLCYYQGMSVVQTARTLELPRETVRARLQRAIGHLRSFLNSKGKDINAAAIVTLLWQDGSIQAPGALCAALDRALPGKPCAQMPASPSHFGAAQTGALVPVAASSIAAISAALLVVAGVVAVTFWLGRPLAISRVEVVAGDRGSAFDPAVAVKKSGASRTGASRSQPGSVEVRKEDEVKSKIGAMVLAGSILMPMAMADEPNAQLNDVVAQIAARREAKDAANATLAQKDSVSRGGTDPKLRKQP
jgi:RNA polymerase sigma-70 factor (ECF subfamily)